VQIVRGRRGNLAAGGLRAATRAAILGAMGVVTRRLGSILLVAQARASDNGNQNRVWYQGSTKALKRAPGTATWMPVVPPTPSCAGNVVAGGVLTRGDLPETVQVGLALNFSQGADLDVTFDELAFVPLAATATATDCTRD
jgi:hypothetical protein